MTRKIIQISAAFDNGDGYGMNAQPSYRPAMVLHALCDDGTVWWRVHEPGVRDLWHRAADIPQGDADPIFDEVAPPPPLPAPTRWPPMGIDHPIWAVSIAGDHVMVLDGPDDVTLAIDAAWVFVEGKDEADALRCYAARDVKGAYVTKMHATIDGAPREYLSDCIPF